MKNRSLFAALPTALVLVAPAAADDIHLTNGSTIADVEITKESIDVVEYKEGKDKKDVPSDQVLAIEYTRKPKLIDQALTALADEAFEDAALDLEDYIVGVIGKPPRRFEWAPAFAMYKQVEIYEQVGELGLLVKGADRLLEHHGDSRYGPLAHIKKSQALFDAGKGTEAKTALAAFGRLIEQHNLSARWKLEHELRQILFDDGLKATERKSKLTDVSARAGRDNPIVRNRAQVALGEVMFEEGDLEAAEKVFDDVANNPRADSRTLAAAYTGLGDCLYRRGVKMNEAGEAGSPVLKDALKSFMRVAVLYGQEIRYVPKAMFYAGRCYDLIDEEGGKDRAQKLYSKVVRAHGDSPWAREARGFRR